MTSGQVMAKGHVATEVAAAQRTTGMVRGSFCWWSDSATFSDVFTKYLVSTCCTRVSVDLGSGDSGRQGQMLLCLRRRKTKNE